MANEPSWEDIFTPTPADGEPARREVPGAAPAQNDPFADLFRDRKSVV